MKQNNNNKLAVKMLIAMLAGIGVGLVFMFIRESMGADSALWQTINKVLFQDITAEGAQSAIGLFYICGQMFVKALQLVIVPMVFSSIVMAIAEISEASTLGRISAKTIGWFMTTTGCALTFGGAVSFICYKLGLFNVVIEGVTASTGSTGSNPLNVILNIIPSNIVQVFSSNGSVLSIVFLAVVIGLALNVTKMGKGSAIYKVCEEISHIIVVFLNFVVNKFGPVAIFMLLSRTFATYGISYLKPAAAYFVLCFVLLLIFLFAFYPLVLAAKTKLSPVIFIKKIFKVIVFGFSTSSSAATLPLNMDVTTKEFGVDNQIASFVLPLGMTVNMDGTAIMQVVATLFVASAGGFDVSLFQLVMIMVLALIASVGTPAAPGAGAVVLFTILSGVGFTNETALIAYTIILAINRPIEMLVTSLNVVGDSTTAIVVAKSEGKLNEDIYNA